MATITPDEGLEFIKDRTLAEPETDGWQMWQVGVGTGTQAVAQTDTQLDNEVYRANNDDSNVAIEDSSTDGEIVVKITVSGGTEVPAGTSLTEFAIWAVDPNDEPTDDTTDGKDRMLHREVRSGITLESGDRKTFQIIYNVERP